MNRFRSLVLALASVCSLAGSAQDAAIWRDAWQLESGTIAIPAAGEYRIWLWGPSNTAVRVTLAGQDLASEFSGDPRRAPEFAWVKAGTMALDAGDHACKLGYGVATMALSTREDFDPARASRDRRVFPVPRGTRDGRITAERHTDTVFTMPHYASREVWESQATRLRQRILIACGLYPMPEKTPLNARIFDRIERDGYSVEKVHFEALPGFFVTGNLYRPLGNRAPVPGIVMPHGHWSKGRLENTDTGSVPARGITFARMGAVAFTYDMLGYNDSKQFEHRWSTPERALWGIHPFALQLWSSIRAVDFLQSLPDVDPDRIACTGASGGGTQTFALSAVDDRVKVSAPVNMISSTMQGGCVCENAPLIRIDHSNMEIGALAAPRPMLMVSATGDWTRETPRIEFPAIRSIYALYGRERYVANVHIDAGHNYNRDSRDAVYRFFAEHLLGRPQPDFEEPAFEVEAEADLRVFPNALPENAKSSDEIIAGMIAAKKTQLEDMVRAVPFPLRSKFFIDNGYALVPGPDPRREALQLAFAARDPDPNDLDAERFGMDERGSYVVERWIIGDRTTGARIPAILYRPASAEQLDTVILVHSDGKAAFADPAGTGPGEIVLGILAKNKAAIAIDPFLIGEHHSPFEQSKRTRAGGFHDTFNPTDTACRVQDILTTAAFARSRRDLTGRVKVIGLGDAGIWALFAAGASEKIGGALVDADGFDNSRDEAWTERHYVPAIRSLGDVRLAANLFDPNPLWVFNTRSAFDLGDAAWADFASPSLGTRVSDGMPSVQEILDAV